jgi:hypothetical protein
VYSPSVLIVLFPPFCFLQEESFLVGRIVAKHRDPQLKVRWCVTKLKHDLRALAARHVILAFSAKLARLIIS